MASQVDICNLALSRLGDEATVSSIDPPEGSVQASHAAKFYPIARDTLLESHTWGFATRRTTLATLSITNPSTWKYAYATPSDAVNYIAILDPLAFKDTDVQPFVLESLITGDQVIYTDQVDAVLRYTALVTDTTKFSPLFVDSLSWLLASYMAGPLLKGEGGRTASIAAYKMYVEVSGNSMASDANQRKYQPAQNYRPGWIAQR